MSAPDKTPDAEAIQQLAIEADILPVHNSPRKESRVIGFCKSH